MLGPGARMASTSTAEEEEKSTPAPIKAGRRAGHRNRPSSSAAPTGGFMSSPRSPTHLTDDDPSAADPSDPSTSRKPSRRRKPAADDDDSPPPPVSPPPADLPSSRGPAGDTLASAAEADVDSDRPPPQPKTSSWSTSTPAEDVSKAGVQSPTSSPPLSQQPPFGRRTHPSKPTPHSADDVITTLEDIPDLEDAGAEDLTLVVADNVKARSHVVQGLSELDRELEGGGVGGRGGEGMGGAGGMNVWLMNRGEVDVSLLLAVMGGVKGVDEGDTVWEFDALFSEVSSEMYAEEERDDGDADADADDAAKPTSAPAVAAKRPSLSAK